MRGSEREMMMNGRMGEYERKKTNEIKKKK